MANTVKLALIARIWFWMTYIPYTGQDYKESAGDDSVLLEWLWQKYMSWDFPAGIPDGVDCPRAFLRSQEGGQAAIAWRLVERRFKTQLWAMSDSQLREFARQEFVSYQHKRETAREYAEWERSSATTDEGHAEDCEEGCEA